MLRTCVSLSRNFIAARSASTAKVAVGQRLPDFEFKTPKMEPFHTDNFKGKKAEKLKKKGVDLVACTAVNDPFVLAEYAKSMNTEGKILFLADGSGEFANKIGLTKDLSGHGLGIRSARYAMFLDDGVIKYLGVDEPTSIEKSGANAIIDFLEKK